MIDDDPPKQGRAQSAARSHTRKNQAVHKTPFLLRDPARDELVGRGINHGFTRSQRKADRDQQGQCVRD